MQSFRVESVILRFTVFWATLEVAIWRIRRTSLPPTSLRSARTVPGTSRSLVVQAIVPVLPRVPRRRVHVARLSQLHLPLLVPIRVDVLFARSRCSRKHFIVFLLSGALFATHCLHRINI